MHPCNAFIVAVDYARYSKLYMCNLIFVYPVLNYVQKDPVTNLNYTTQFHYNNSSILICVGTARLESAGAALFLPVSLNSRCLGGSRCDVLRWRRSLIRVGTARLESAGAALFLPVSLHSRCLGSRCDVHHVLPEPEQP